MPGPDKPIRSLKDNPSGKVVADGAGNRWEWGSEDETSHLLKQLNNDELSIEKTDLHPAAPHRAAKPRAGTQTERDAAPAAPKRPLKPGARDAGGGFNPYDNSGKPRRR